MVALSALQGILSQAGICVHGYYDIICILYDCEYKVVLPIRNVVPDNFASTFLFDKCILLTIINVLMKSTLRIINTWTMINVATYDRNDEF